MRKFDFSKPYNTIHNVTPFDQIQVSDYEPGIMQGIKEEDDEIESIINNPDIPTFENTIEALEKTGQTLHRVTNVFFNLLSCETNDEMEEIANKVQPALSEHSNNIGLNEKLFARIKTVYDSHPVLNNEQQKLLDETYKSFVRRGANLSADKKETFRRISLEMSQNALQFRQNSLKETNSYILQITDKNRLKGMPETSLEAAAQTAKEKNLEGWVFTLHAPSYGPFMSFCEDRDLRKELYLAYNTKCAHGGNTDNQELVRKLVNGRIQLAQLLGYPDFASYVLENRMAENKNNVFNLLEELLEKYRPSAEKEVKAIENLAHEMEGEDFQMMPWDFSFYSDKLKLKLFNINKEILRPYFQVEKVIEGVFALATRLYGITFKENREIPVFNPDVIPFEVFDKDGSYLAVLYTDFYPRDGKRSGAWMTSYKEQWIEKDGTNSRPHVSITTNFTKPTASKPALLTPDEVQTFLHEFGHALHGIFANTTYESLSGTNVYWDFVELPSQFMENYANEKEFLNTFAYHYETGEALPIELIRRINDSRNFNVAYACLRQISFGLLDMAYYTRKELLPQDTDIKAFEQKVWERTKLLPIIPECCMSTQFSHIMTGGYAAGYYSYKWAEVLDADAFEYFQETGIFNQETANKFRNMLSKGGTVPPMRLYEDFRGKAPSIHALLHRNGII